MVKLFGFLVYFAYMVSVFGHGYQFNPDQADVGSEIAKVKIWVPV